MICLQDPPETFLTAGINISGIKIIDALLYGQKNFLFRFFVVDASSFFAESQAAISQLGNLIAISVKSVFHSCPPMLSQAAAAVL